MARRDQPYLPLYIQDIMTDEKLNECCAATHGIFIKGIMCLMHKSETYGKILLKQKHKQNQSKEQSFASQLAKHLPYSEQEIHSALVELIGEGVCHFDGDYLVQKRMVKDGEISDSRAFAGKNGGTKTMFKNKNFAQAKPEANVQANTEYEYENKNEVEKGGAGGKQFPDESDIPKIELTNIQVGSVQQAVKLSKRVDLSPEEVNGFFAVFKSQHFTGQKYYQNKAAIYSHFLNWMKTQNINGKINSKNSSNGKPTFTDKLRESESWFPDEVGKTGD